MPKLNLDVQKVEYGFRINLPPTGSQVEYDAHRFEDREPGVVTLISRTGGPPVFSLNVSPYRKIGDTWRAENLCAGLAEYTPGTLEHAAFEALSAASQNSRE